MKPALLSLLLPFISVYASPSSTSSYETKNFDENEWVILLENDDCGYVRTETGAPKSKKMEIEARPSLPSSPVSIESDIKANLEVESDGIADLGAESVPKADIEADSGQVKLRASPCNLPVRSASSFSDPSSLILEMEKVIELKRKRKEEKEEKEIKEMKMKEIKIMEMEIKRKMKEMKTMERKMKEMKTIKTKETMEMEMEKMEMKMEKMEMKMKKIEKKMEQKKKKMEKRNFRFSLKSPSSDSSSSSSSDTSSYRRKKRMSKKSPHLSLKCRNGPQFEVIDKFCHSWEYAKVCRKVGMVPAEVTSSNIFSAVSAIHKAGYRAAWINSWNGNSYAGSLILIDPDNSFYLRVDKDIVTYDWLESYNAALCMRA